VGYALQHHGPFRGPCENRSTVQLAKEKGPMGTASCDAENVAMMTAVDVVVVMMTAVDVVDVVDVFDVVVVVNKMIVKRT